MTKQEFRDRLLKGKLILDGATGTNLQERGMPAGVCPEEWILENREVLAGLQMEYIKAGSNVLYTPTFSGNRIKLAEYGLQDDIYKMNKELVEISKDAVKNADNGQPVFLAGDITMTGKQVYPIGEMPFEELVEVYKQQILCLEEAGVDFLAVETMMSLQECRVAVIAAKEVSNLPVMVTLTFNDDGRTLYGTSPETAALVMVSLGVDAVGVNCSSGPDRMEGIIRKMAEYADIPLVVKPNAGLPSLKDGKTVYEMAPDEFANEMIKLVDAGADILGGCCGTTPEHIRALVNLLNKNKMINKVSFVEREGKCVRRALSNERSVLNINLDGCFHIIGERINPTGKKKLQEELRNGGLELVTQMAEAQEEAGASVLDVNMGMNGIDEKEMMLEAVNELTMVSNLPLSIDSSYVEVIEAALRIYPGRGLINSISLEKEKIEKLIPIAKKYGAMFILLPLSGKGLPKNMAEKISIINTVIDEAFRHGLRKEDIIVDGLVQTVGANRQAAVETLDTISYCRNELGVATVCGLSNISFGLPERTFVNSSFMSIAISRGLTMAIANPSQDLLMHSVFASDLLMGKPEADTRYIERVMEHKVSVLSGDVDIRTVDSNATKKDVVSGSGKKASGALVDGKEDINTTGEKMETDALFEAVVKGRKKQIEKLTDVEIKSGRAAADIIDNSMIPAITYVGELYEKQVYFLPQLIASAETMEIGMGVLEPLLSGGDGKEALGTVVIATVEHDIHNIGKNLVALMLKNYGYNVIDLGKDVPAEKIIEAAKREDADIIGLSALMTTTMMEMKKVVELAKKEGVRAKIMIGGAVITQGFADEIGADGYSKDAQDAVMLAGRLMNEKKDSRE